MISQQSPSQSVVLIATNDYGATHRYELRNDQGVFVGKSSNCGLQLHDNKLSDIHCRIGMEQGKVRIQNWMSAEGTRVNGHEIDSEHEIGLHDVIQVGSHKIRISLSKKETADSDSPDRNEASQRADVDDARHEQVVAEQFVTEQVVAEQRLAPEPDADTAPTDDECSTLDLLQRFVDEVTDGESGSEASSHDAVFAKTAELTEDRLESRQDTDPDAMDFDSDFFSFEEEETFDRETVALLQAEIEDLRAALAQRDAEQFNDESDFTHDFADDSAEDSDEVLHRMQDLIEEANRSDERAAILEEMLHAAEDANRSERDERNQLEAWVRDIEKRIGLREEEHAAEIEALKLRLHESAEQSDRLQRQLRQAASSGASNTNKQYEEMLENLQRSHRELQDRLADSEKKCLSLEKRLASAESGQDELVRAERAKLAQEQAKVSRMRYELSSKLAEIEKMPKSENRADQETGERIRALREHLREIHEQEKQEVKEETLATRLAKLWKRVEY